MILYEIHKHEVLQSKVHGLECETPWKDPSRLPLAKSLLSMFFLHFSIMTKERIGY